MAPQHEYVKQVIATARKLGRLEGYKAFYEEGIKHFTNKKIYGMSEGHFISIYQKLSKKLDS